MWGVELVVMAMMVAVNSIFAAYEIALATVTLARLERLVDEKRAGARAALSMKQNMEGSLAVVQLGITLVGAVAAAVGGAGAEEQLSPQIALRFGVSDSIAEALAIIGVVVPLTFVTILAGELIPKVFAIRNAEIVCLWIAPFMRAFAGVVRPAVWVFETLVTSVLALTERLLTRSAVVEVSPVELAEIRRNAATARAARLIGRREEDIIVSASEMRTYTVREIVVPKEQMRTLHVGASLADCLIATHLDMHTRFPVVERKDDPTTVIGYVNVKDIIATMHLSPKDPTLRAIVRAIPSLSADTPISECLERMMNERNHIAVVHDKDGSILGMITLEDVLEELVGEIEDEYDRLPSHVTSTGKGFVIGGGAPLDKVALATGIDFRALAAHEGVTTLADWVGAELARDVAGGDVVEMNGVRVLVRKVRRHRAQETLVTPSAPVPASAGGDPTRTSPHDDAR